MERIVAEVLSVKADAPDPILVVELRDGSQALVLYDPKFATMVQVGDDFLFEGSWSGALGKDVPPLFRAKVAINNLMREYSFDQWQAYLGVFNAAEIDEIYQISGEGNYAHFSATNFHLAVIERFFQCAADLIVRGSPDLARQTIHRAKAAHRIALKICDDKRGDVAAIDAFYERVKAANRIPPGFVTDM